MALALPAIATNITTPLLNLADMAICGRVGAAAYIAAIALAGSVFNMLYWIFNFLRMGTSGLTAQAYGRTDSTAADAMLIRSLAVGLALGCLMMFLRGKGGGVILSFMDADDSARELASRYFDICILGAPAMMMSYSVTGWLTGMQDTRATLYIAVFTNLFNIAASCVLVLVLHLGIAGVALGTLSAQWAGIIFAAILIVRRHHPRFSHWAEALRQAGWKNFFNINRDIFLRTCCLVAVTVWFTRAGALQGVVPLAANALLMQLFMFFSFFLDGFAFAGEALAGKFHGARLGGELLDLSKKLLRIGLGFAVVFSLLYMALGDAFVNIMANDGNVGQFAHHYILWAAAIPLCSFGAFICDGIFVGLTRSGLMLGAMAVAVAAFFATYFLLTPRLLNHALWLAFDIYLLVRSVSELWLLHRKVLHPLRA